MRHAKNFSSSSIALLASALVTAALAGFGCGSDKPPATSTAAAVAGPADMHCIVNGVELKQEVGMCVADEGTHSALSSDGGAGDAEADGGDTDAEADGGHDHEDGGHDHDAGDHDHDGGGAGELGEPRFNSEADDDDCKYHVKWAATEVKENAGVTFEVKLTRKADGKPATGGDVQIEAFLDDAHPTPSVDIPSKEAGGGTYRVGPVLFDSPGNWTVRFHFYETCSDVPEDSPHGHVAFFVKVP